MARSVEGSETVDAFVGLVVERGIAPRDAVERLRTKDRRAASLARRLCEERLLKPEAAWELLAEVRRRRRGKTPGPAIPENAPRMGPYRLLGELGRGGMGVVHRAWDERLRREVALKTIPGVADPAVRERLLREARAAGKLRHPGIVGVFAAEQIDGVCVLALELVRGTSLEKKITTSGPLPPERAAALVRDVALAVAHAHDNGVIHRDLKSANVLLDAQELPHLTDFGVARDMNASAMTQTGVAVGTPAYMSPEQALGEPEKIGPATDVYGLGAVLYETLSGRAPFEGQNGIAILRQVIEDEPESPSAVRRARGLAIVPRDLETVCLKALEKAPERRYERAQDLASDLERFLKGEPVVARPISWPERALRKVRRRPLLFSVVVIVVLVQLVLLAAARAQARHEARARRADFEARLARFSTTLSAIPLDTILKHRQEFGDQAAPLLADALALGQSSDAEDTALARSALLALARVATRIDEPGLALFSTKLSLAKAMAPDERDEAMALAARALDLEETREPLARIRADLASERADALTRAVALAETLVAKHPRACHAWFACAEARAATGDVAGALAAVDRAIALEPRCGRYFALRAEGERKKGDPVAARADAERAVSLQEGASWEGYRIRGLLRRDGHDETGARADLERALDFEPPARVVAELRAVLDQGSR